MGIEYDDLPQWEFSVENFSPGGYRVRAIRNGGVAGEASGVDPDALLDDLKCWARRVDEDLAKNST